MSEAPLAWSEVKQVWCCRHHHKGCTTATTAPYWCHLKSVDTWSVGEQAWCCLMRYRGCQPTTTTRFDCAEGVRNWATSWSEAKKLWCCTHSGTGCLTTTTTTLYSCVRLLSPSWSPGHKAFCCLLDYKNCEPEVPARPMYDCFDSVVEEWTTVKQQWCCLHEDVACFRRCDETEPGGEDAWSAWKRDWCCRHAGKGCRPALFSTDCSEPLKGLIVHGTMDAKKSYCCRERSVHCPTTTHAPYDCSLLDESARIAWSIGRKAWCCLHGGQTCKDFDGILHAL